jgi:hypothetical protein
MMVPITSHPVRPCPREVLKVIEIGRLWIGALAA